MDIEVLAVEDSAGAKQKTARAKSNMRGDEAVQDKKVTAAAAGSLKTLEPPESGVKIKKSKSPANEVQSPAKQAEIPNKK